MQDFKKRRPNLMLRFLLRLGGLLLLLFVTYYAVRGAWSMYQKFTESAESDSVAKSQLADLESQQAKVSASLAELDTARGQEAQIRERYGVAKPGEGEIEIVRDASTSDGVAPMGENWWQRLWHALFVW